MSKLQDHMRMHTCDNCQRIMLHRLKPFKKTHTEPHHKKDLVYRLWKYFHPTLTGESCFVFCLAEVTFPHGAVLAGTPGWSHWWACRGWRRYWSPPCTTWLVVKGGGLLPSPWQIGSPPPLLLRGHLHLVLVLLLLLLGARIKFELGLYEIIPYCQDYWVGQWKLSGQFYKDGHSV